MAISRYFNGLSVLVVALTGVIGCQVDTANPIPAPGSGTPVNRLSELGIFVGNPADQIPRPDFHPYNVNVSLYSDGASKLRFVYVPPGTKINVTNDRWTIPDGAYLVKTFYFPRDARNPALGRKLIETRFLVKRSNGFVVSTYLWNDEQTDAVASGGNVNVPISWIDESGAEHDDHFHVPGTSQCQSCHSERALGMRTRQWAEVTPGTTGQLERFVESGVLDGMPPGADALQDPSGTAPLDERARSYLDANCAHCHGPGGSAASTDLYWDLDSTTMSKLPACRSASTVDGTDRVLVPGSPGQSTFLARMLSSDPFLRMPRGPTHVPDGQGIAVLNEWVAQMPAEDCK